MSHQRPDADAPQRLEILIVSGIWPPDVGGPASHGPELGRFLAARGHAVRAVTTVGDLPALDPGFPVAQSPRRGSRLVRIPRGGAAVLKASADSELIYATGMYTRSAVAAAARRVPLVVKLVNDPAYERARSMGLFDGGLEEFQEGPGNPIIASLKRLRRATLGRARRIIIPSRYLAEIASTWGLAPERLTVIPNPAAAVDSSVPREALRQRLGITGPTFVFAGRLVPQKNLELAISALRRVSEARLVLIGEGPEQGRLKRSVEAAGVRDRVGFQGALPRSEAVAWMRAADAAVLPSNWENFPHAAVEALTAGTPVVATSVGGVPEIVESGVNGILVTPGDVEGFADALKALAIPDSHLLARLREEAARTGETYSPEVVFSSVERELERAYHRG